jgi:polygalacturonase
MIHHVVLALLSALLVAGVAGSAGAGVGDFDVREFGATGDGNTLDTKAIQAAIDRCAAEGGGRVVLAGGRVYLSGTVVLKNNVTLLIDAGSVLRGSLDKDDYRDITPEIPFVWRERFTRQLIYAEKQTNIGIAGLGTIDGQGAHEAFDPRIHGADKDRPYLLRFAECTSVVVRQVTLLESARWCAHLLACDDVVIDGVTVLSSQRENRDGLDIDSCNRVRISNCRVETGDDAIVLKATANRPCKNVTVVNCHLSSRAAAFKLGTESNGGFETIAMSNCTIRDTNGAGISLLMVDGGVLDGVTISNVVMDNVASPIFLRLGNRARPLPGEDPPAMGSMRNIIIRGVQAKNASALGCIVAGIGGQYIENLTLRDIRVHSVGGGTLEDAKATPREREASYPVQRMFGAPPAYGMFIRHVRNLTLDGVDLSFDQEATEQRPALRLDDVIDANLTKLRALAAPAMPTMRLVDCQGVLVHGCRVAGPQGPFVAVEGARTGEIVLQANDLRHASPAVLVDSSVPENAVQHP